jgi:hypothetical protein
LDLKLGIEPKAGNFLSGNRERGRGERDWDRGERHRDRKKETELTIKIPSKAG